MIRCVKIVTGPDDVARFEEGELDLGPEKDGRATGQPIPVSELSFAEVPAGGSATWHPAPRPQFVLSLTGVMRVETPSGASMTIHPGTVLIAQDTIGQGHRWSVVGNEPWRHAYVVYRENADLKFKAKPAG